MWKRPRGQEVLHPLPSCRRIDALKTLRQRRSCLGILLSGLSGRSALSTYRDILAFRDWRTV